jgi:integrase
MTARPILFSGAMVRSLLDGTKTQTRRVVKVPADATDVRYWAPPSGRSQPGWADPGLNYWTPALKVLGIRYRPPYNTRHTYATMMLMAGMTPAFCAKQLGHSVDVFLRTYSKWLDGGQNDLEMQRMEVALSGRNSGKNLGIAGAT